MCLCEIDCLQSRKGRKRIFFEIGRLYETMRQRDNENECWGLGQEEGLMVKVVGLKFFL